MNYCLRVSFLFIFIASFISCTTNHKSAQEDWEILFNGTDLNNWDKYLGPVRRPGISDDSLKLLPPIGLNKDTANVFSIVDLDGENAIRVSGEYFGGISTKKDFENIHLQLQFKWGELKWFPRNKDSDRRDSGLLYYGVGEHGVGDGFWLQSQEFQIQEGDCGDYWGVAGALADIPASLNQDGIYQFNPRAQLLTFDKNNEIGRFCKKFPDAEKPNGEWNTLDLYTFNGTSLHIVNGTLTMKLVHSRVPSGDGEIALTKGKIQFQSEGAEVFYRNIRVQKIIKLPDFSSN